MDEIDSGLDVDALRDVSKAINALMTPSNSVLMITHYRRLLEFIKPDYIHVMVTFPFVVLYFVYYMNRVYFLIKLSHLGAEKSILSYYIICIYPCLYFRIGCCQGIKHMHLSYRNSCSIDVFDKVNNSQG